MEQEDKKIIVSSRSSPMYEAKIAEAEKALAGEIADPPFLPSLYELDEKEPKKVF